MENQNSPSRNEALETHNSPEINRENQERDFPGYPHYSSRLDVLSNTSGAVKTDVDVDDLSRNIRNTPQASTTEKTPDSAYNDIEDVLPSDANDPKQGDLLDPDADVTEDDFLLLGDVDRDQDDSDDEMFDEDADLDDVDDDGDELNEESGRRAGSGRDLDVPDDELDNAGSAMLPEDEENDYYDLKGDDAEKLEDKESRFLY